MDDSYGLRQVQEANLKILKEIDRICEKYRIDYMLDAGTLLGAVRHRGFIPWDDDADVAMRRNCWSAFRRVAARELPETMRLLEPAELARDGKFYDFTPRILYLPSRRHVPDEASEYYGEKLNHLWVDIFILDRLPDGSAGAAWQRALQKLVYALSMGHRRKLDYRRYSPAQRAGVAVLSTAGKLLPMSLLVRLQDRFARSARRKETERVYYSNYQPDYLHVTLERELTQRTVSLPFEDTELSAPAGWHEILTRVYGDYMQPPSEEDRRPSHGSREIEIYE